MIVMLVKLSYRVSVISVRVITNDSFVSNFDSFVIFVKIFYSFRKKLDIYCLLLAVLKADSESTTSSGFQIDLLTDIRLSHAVKF
jgi:hypothetical protein